MDSLASTLFERETCGETRDILALDFTSSKEKVGIPYKWSLFFDAMYPIQAKLDALARELAGKTPDDVIAIAFDVMSDADVRAAIAK
jgi:hypothetical protein